MELIAKCVGAGQGHSNQNSQKKTRYFVSPSTSANPPYRHSPTDVQTRTPSCLNARRGIRDRSQINRYFTSVKCASAHVLGLHVRNTCLSCSSPTKACSQSTCGPTIYSTGIGPWVGCNACCSGVESCCVCKTLRTTHYTPQASHQVTRRYITRSVCAHGSCCAWFVSVVLMS